MPKRGCDAAVDPNKPVDEAPKALVAPALNAGAPPKVGGAPKTDLPTLPELALKMVAVGFSGLLNDENRPPPVPLDDWLNNPLAPPPPVEEPNMPPDCGKLATDVAVNVAVLRIPPLVPPVDDGLVGIDDAFVVEPNVRVGFAIDCWPAEATPLPPKENAKKFLGGSLTLLFSGLDEPGPPKLKPLVKLFVDESMSASISFELLSVVF